MSSTYGQVIPDLTIDGKPAPYGVINERAVRATAGIMFVIGFSTLWYTRTTSDFTLMYIVVPLFWLDFFLKAVFAPKYSVIGFFGRMLVKKQKPEWVGAIQKRFAWGIGLFMATLMIIGTLMLGLRGSYPLTICGICLTFMWLETSAGICVGCKIYTFLTKHNIIKKPEHAPACPGGACSIKR